MWDLKLICVFTLIYLTVIDCRLIPEPNRRALQNKNKQRLSKMQLSNDFLQRGKNLLSKVRIPNRDFCSEMMLEPEDQYRVLPWWYNYCQDLKEKDERGYKGNVHYTAIHRYILDEVQAYKKKQKIKGRLLEDLKKELV